MWWFTKNDERSNIKIVSLKKISHKGKVNVGVILFVEIVFKGSGEEFTKTCTIQFNKTYIAESGIELDIKYEQCIRGFKDSDLDYLKL